MLLAIAMLCTSMAMAIPAHPGTATVRQPDGTTLTIRLIGDEYLHYNTTADGYTILQQADGAYVYAERLSDGQLAATTRVAHDEGQRTADERQWLLQTPRRLQPQMSSNMARARQSELDRRAQARNRASLYDYNNFRGLIVLVQYNDRSFSRSDIKDVIDGMVNTPDYKGYDNSRVGRFTGSVRDYFYDNSAGMFSPEFDIVGPVTIDYSQYYAHGSENAARLMLAALNAADSLINFQDYDRDDDGLVDMVYFIYAGVGSNIQGNDQRLLWPHASFIANPDGGYNWRVRKDGVTMGRYACSTELTGSATSNFLDGIGVICHEFGHVLGLPDLYDTDYEKSGGETAHPAEWSIMAGGGYLNNGRTPCGYTLYERASLGFAVPQVFSSEGEHTLQPIGTSNTGYKLITPVRNEFFLIENRQNTSKWDRYLPGHGMLVFRVDSTSTSVWTSNVLNNNPEHMYFEMVRAGGGNLPSASASDPFPGLRNVTMLDNETEPANLRTWAGKPTPFGLQNISESSDGVISFNLFNVNILKSISLPAQLAVGRGLSITVPTTLKPATAIYAAQWTSSDESVATVSNDGLVTGVAVGECDITVEATSNGNMHSATCHVVVEEADVKAGIADFRAMPVGSSAAVMLQNALVVYVNEQDAYVRDATGAIVFANTGLPLQVGDCLNGFVMGKLSSRNNVPVLLPVEGSTHDKGYTVTSGNEVEPRPVELGSLSEADYGDLITVKSVQMVSDAGIWLRDAEHNIRVYNTFQLRNVKTTKNYSLWYDITGIYHTNVLKGEVIDELSFVSTTPFVQVAAPDAISLPTLAAVPADSPVSVYTAAGRHVATCTAGQLGQLPLRSGVYVVRSSAASWKMVRR